MEDEKTICEVTPSQILNLRAYVFGVIASAIIITIAILTHTPSLAFLLVLPLLYAVGKWLQINSTKLKLTDQRIILREGILNKRTNETELYRVRDSSIEEPFLYRMFGCGNITIYTTDDAEGTLHLAAYKKPHWLKDQVRNYSEICRQRKRWGNDNVFIQEFPQQ
jgi:uncharacterized membrane protein YdbT with pleckstrin-like domain